MKVFLIISLFMPFISCIEWLKFLDLPKHDSNTRVCQLNSATVNDYLINNQNNGLVVMVKQSNAAVKQNSCGDDFAQSSADLLSNRNITVCELSLIDETNLQLGSAGDVIVYLNGKQYQYYGRRTSPALLSYILKLSSSHVKLITGKLDKIAYDLIPGPKLVGFFMPSTPDYIAYETMALKHSPSVPFYVVLDRLVAKHLKLSVVGQINLVKPLEKVAVPCPVNPATAQDIEAFIESNKGVVMKYLSEHNLYDPQLQNPNKTTLLAIGERSSGIGGYFHNILTKTIRNITRQNVLSQAAAQTAATIDSTVGSTISAVNPNPVEPIVPIDSIEILWIDPQVFPTMYVMMDQIERLYGLPAGLEAYLGVIHSASNQSAWFDTTQINITADKNADHLNIQLLKDWVITVINNQTVNQLTEPPIETTNVGSIQQFLKEPKSVSVIENGILILECEITNKVGDCLWLRNGQNIGSNLARVSPDYKWAANNVNGNCGLIISKAVSERDSGEWVCEVTGDLNNPTITSSVAVVEVRPVPKANTEL